jgi:hypothetical protein
MFDFSFMRNKYWNNANNLIKQRRALMREARELPHAQLIIELEVELGPVGILLDDIVEGCIDSTRSQKVSVTQEVEGNVR